MRWIVLGAGKGCVQVLKVEETGFSRVWSQRGAGVGGRDEAGDWRCRIWVRGNIGQICVLEGSLWQERRGPGPKLGLWRGHRFGEDLRLDLCNVLTSGGSQTGVICSQNPGVHAEGGFVSRWVGRGGPALTGPERLCCLPASDRELGGRHPTSKSHWLPLSFPHACPCSRTSGLLASRSWSQECASSRKSPYHRRRSPQFDSTRNGL